MSDYAVHQLHCPVLVVKATDELLQAEQAERLAAAANQASWGEGVGWVHGSRVHTGGGGGQLGRLPPKILQMLRTLLPWT